MLGKYEILRSLGTGAMGEVFLAHQGAVGRDVAIKTILPSVARGEEAEGRFRREAEAAGRLNHPNLVTIFDFDKDGDTLFLVMEFVPGDDLEELIRDRALSHGQFLDVLAQVCDGLGHAHRNGIIHRDIKPANIRVIRDGRTLQAKIMDFGIARVQDSTLTSTGIVMGTVSYMAPEYIQGGGATPQSDLFAVGVMLYECLTGRKPFPGETTTTILFKIVSEAPAPIDPADLPGISPAIREVLDRVLAKTPGERFRTAEDLARALRASRDPGWDGLLDEGTALIGPPSGGDGTQLLAAPARGEAMPPTRTGASTQAGPAVPGAPSGRKVRTALLAAMALLLLLGGGIRLARRPRAAALPPAVPPAGTGSPSPVAAAQPPTPSPTLSPTQPPTLPPPEVPPEAPAARPPIRPSGAPVQALAALVEADPRQAAAQIRPLAAADPGHAELQGLYLAALYRSGNAWDFERALARITAAGVAVKALRAVPAFRAALVEENRLRRANPPAGLLSEETLAKLQDGS